MSFGRPTIIGRANHSSSPSTNGLIKIVLVAFAQASHALVIPLTHYYGLTNEDIPSEDSVNVWLYLVIAAVLVLAGGAFAGLTIALMGQDGIYLQVIATSGEGTQQRHAESVYKLLQKGKHWVLVTLLLSNVIVNETLPIVLDRSLGGGWPAVLGSTVLIVIFGEVIPQSVCVRYGLSIGAFMAPCVIGLMWILAPIAWPIAKLLDILLGKDHGTVYKKSGLKTLVTLHKTLGASPTERLNQDEVTIISAVLDLKDKAVGDIMTPMENVFTMSEDTVLNVETMNTILSAGYSRIPIYEPGNPNNFVGMLLVKILITYDPEDCKKVSEFALATLPETRPETSCLDIVNFFQEGKSHMVLVSEFPAENYGAIGVVTLEDVIEELIGEEIIDESDVFIDVQKAIRRLAPAPKARTQKHHIVDADNVSNQSFEKNISKATENATNSTSKDLSYNLTVEDQAASNHVEPSSNITFTRKASEVLEGNSYISVRRDSSDVREHLKHLGPSNLASRPKSTRYSTVKIKSAYSQTRSTSNGAPSASCDIYPGDLISDTIVEEPNTGGSETDKLIKHFKEDEAGPINPSDVKKSSSIHVAQPGYGSFSSFKLSKELKPAPGGAVEGTSSNSNHGKSKSSLSRSFSGHTSNLSSDGSDIINSPNSKSTNSSNILTRKKRAVQSGSLTENIIEAGGIQKLVLETNSSGEELEPKECISCNQQDEETSTDLEDYEDMPDKILQHNGDDQQALLSHHSKKCEGKKKRRKNNRKKKGI